MRVFEDGIFDFLRFNIMLNKVIISEPILIRLFIRSNLQ